MLALLVALAANPTPVPAPLPPCTNPRCQEHRPPEQTEIQAQVRLNNLKDAKKNSDAAKPTVLAAFKPSELPANCQGKTPAELLAMMDYEIARIPIIHNAPFTDAQGGCCGDDTDLATNLHNG